MRPTITLLVVLATALLLLGEGCSGASNTNVLAPPNSESDPSSAAVPPPQDPATPAATGCSQGRIYKGLGGRVLVAGRLEGEENLDRSRIKPYSALAGEFARVLGTAPSGLDTMGQTFGQPPDRWFVEPKASAVTLYTAYRAAFVGCLTYTASDAVYASTPTDSTAQSNCAQFARAFWSRSATSDELAGCVDVAVRTSAKETNARRRWAYTCAAMLDSTGFLTF